MVLKQHPLEVVHTGARLADLVLVVGQTGLGTAERRALGNNDVALRHPAS
jgi:hypothetical protein